MPVYYCSTASCGSKIQYEAIKPAKCPKCQTVFAKAFIPAAPMAQATVRYQSVMVSPPIDPEAYGSAEATPTPTRLQHRAAMVQRSKSARSNARQYYDEDGNPVEVERVVVGGGEDSFDPIEVKRLAQEMAAQMGPAQIIVASQPESAVKFRDWCCAPPEGGQPV